MTLKDVLADDSPWAEVEAWAYGTERECPECLGDGLRSTEPCHTCHGTGKVREAGLVERVKVAAFDGEGWDAHLMLNALRAELGVPDDR